MLNTLYALSKTATLQPVEQCIVDNALRQADQSFVKLKVKLPQLKYRFQQFRAGDNSEIVNLFLMKLSGKWYSYSPIQKYEQTARMTKEQAYDGLLLPANLEQLIGVRLTVIGKLGTDAKYIDDGYILYTL